MGYPFELAARQRRCGNRAQRGEIDRRGLGTADDVELTVRNKVVSTDFVLLDVNIPALSGDRLLGVARKAAPPGTLFVFYSALARGLGQRRAFIVWMVLAVPLSVVFGGGLGPASVLFVGMALSSAALAAALYTWGFRLYRDWVFQRFERLA